MSRWLLPILLLWAICGNVEAGVYHDPDLTWQTIETAHFRIHYHNGEAALAQRFWPKAEHIYEQSCKYLDWYPREKTDVVLTDEFDLSNGYTRVFPYDSIILYVSAPDAVNSLETYDDWLALVFRHEFLHVVHLSMVRGVPRGFQRVFGRHPLLFPNAYQPRWVIEGLATYAETDARKHVGRGQSSYFNMMMRMESLAGLKPLRRVNQPIGSWPAGDVPYLYGVFFFEFVHDKYGDKAIKAMVNNYSDNLVPFRINSNAFSVFHEGLPALWNEYAAWLKQKYGPQVASIKQAGLRVGDNLTGQGYQAGPLRSLGRRIYFYEFNGERHPAIKVIDGTGPARTVLEVNPHTRFSLHRDKGLLLTEPEICRNARLYFDIYRADADGGNYRRLTHCGRYRYAIWNGKGDRIIAVHNDLGNNQLDLLDANGKKLETLWQSKNKEQIGQMSMSPLQPYLVASVWRAHAGWNLEKFDLQTRTWTPLTQDAAIEAEPQFTPDGQAILYSADYDGVYNIYRYDLATGKRTKLTNVLGGAFFPAQAGDRLAYIGYREKGFDVYALPANTPAPVVADTTVAGKAKGQAAPVSDSVAKTPAASMSKPAADQQPSDKTSTLTGTSAVPVKPITNTDKVLPSRPYSPWPSLVPRYWSPYFLVDSQRTQLGLSTSGFDVLQRHTYGAALAYDFKNHVAVGNADYIYDGLWPLLHVGISRDTSLYIDNKNNLVRVRANDDAILEAIVPFLSLEHNWFVHLAMIKQTDHDIWNNGVPRLQDVHNDMGAVALRYNSAKTYPLSVSRSDGRDVRLIYEDSDLYGNSYNKGQVTVGEWREFVPLWGEQVLALRVVEGHGQHNPSPFRLGGIQSDNTVLSAIAYGVTEKLFNKRDYSLRGYSEGHSQLIGKNMRLISAEYRFPIARIEHGWMVPPFGFNQVHGTLFYDAGGVWNSGNGPQHYYRGVGFELNADLDVFYNIRLHTSLGFAKGLDKTLGEDKVYLRVGAQF
ncbi:MAG: hypothetical protein P8019_10905 [Gammaproteobacteria bacterium]